MKVKHIKVPGKFIGVFWVTWAVSVCALYYSQAWRLFELGLSSWISDNDSLKWTKEVMILVMQGFSAWSLPYAGEAAQRAAMGLLGSTILVVTCWVLGMVTCRLLRWESHDVLEKVFYHTTAGFGALSYLLLGTAVLRLYHPMTVYVIVATILLSAGTIWACRSVFKTGKRKQLHQTSQASERQIDANAWPWKAVATISCFLALIGALAPEREYDALWYHLNLPLIWLEKGYLVDIREEYISLYPMTWELLFGAGLTLGGPVSAKLLHFSCFLLTALLTYQFVRRFVSRASPWFAVALFVTIPTILWEATTAYIDLALALHAGAAIYALIRYGEEGGWPWFLMAVLNLGLALATKHLGLFVLALATVLLSAQVWLKTRDLRRAIFMACLLCLLSIILPLPWYIRSWLASGNPVFPELFVVFGDSSNRWDLITQEGLDRFKGQFGYSRTIINFLALPWDMTLHSARYGGALGPLFLMLFPVIFFCRGYGSMLPYAASLVFLYLVLWGSPLSSFQMRFLIPITPFMAVLGATAYGHLQWSVKTAPTKWGQHVLRGGFFILLLLNLPPFISLHEADRSGWSGWLTHVVHRTPTGVVFGRESQDQYLRRMVPPYAAWQYMNSSLSKDARVLTFSGGDHLYSRRERLWSDATIARPAVWGAPAGNEKKALHALKRLNISHILFDKKQLESLRPGTLAIAGDSVKSMWYEWKYEDNYFVLYEIRWNRIKA